MVFEYSCNYKQNVIIDIMDVYFRRMTERWTIEMTSCCFHNPKGFSRIEHMSADNWLCNDEQLLKWLNHPFASNIWTEQIFVIHMAIELMY